LPNAVKNTGSSPPGWSSSTETWQLAAGDLDRPSFNLMRHPPRSLGNSVGSGEGRRPHLAA
jgi:hypothetical protein